MRSERANFPALRCHMGDWTYYITSMPLSEVAKRVQRSKEIYEVKRLEDMVQRELTKRVGSIVDYLLQQPERFFNAIIVGMHEGDPEWYPIDVKESPIIGQPKLMPGLEDTLGIISLTGGESLFAIDGQHRVEAIKRAVAKRDGLGSEHMAVVFVAHRTSTSGRERTRRLFSTLNREAKPVSKGEIIALDEDDAFAITARRVVREYAALSGGFSPEIGKRSLVYFGKTSNIPANNKSSITSILALYDLIELIELPRIGRRPGARAKLTKIRTTDEVLDGIYDRHVMFWEALCSHVPEIGKVAGSNPDMELAGLYRTSDGGHMLFRPVGQKAFARAARVLMDRGRSLDQAVKLLSGIVLQLQERPWINVLWDPHKARMVLSNQLLAQNLFFHMVGQDPHPQTYDLLAEYRKAIGDSAATLHGLSY